MNKEVIPVTDIPKFQSRAEEFFPIQWYKEMLNNSLFIFMKKQTHGMYSNTNMLNKS